MPLSGGNFRVGVFAGAKYVQARLVSTGAGFREYQVAIPKGATVRLFLDTSLGVVDAMGSALAAGRPSASITVGGQAEVEVSLRVRDGRVFASPVAKPSNVTAVNPENDAEGSFGR